MSPSDCQSQCPRCLRHEMSLPAQTLGSRVQIPLEASISVYILCLCSLVYVVALRWADHPPKFVSEIKISEVMNSGWEQAREPNQLRK
jgi:hypothetical protein